MFEKFNDICYDAENKDLLHNLKGFTEYKSSLADKPVLDKYKIYQSEEYKAKVREEETNSEPDGLVILTSTLLDFSEEELPVRFINNEHRMRVAELLARANISITQTRITPVFYIIAGSPYLYNNVEFLFSFLSHTLTADALFDGLIPPNTQEWKLYALALALADEGYVTNLYDMFDGLSDERLDIAVEAIKIRFMPVYIMED